VSNRKYLLHNKILFFVCTPADACGVEDLHRKPKYIQKKKKKKKEQKTTQALGRRIGKPFFFLILPRHKIYIQKKK
jgi:hypothetical protein